MGKEWRMLSMFFAVALCFAIGVGVGLIYAQLEEYRVQWDRERVLIAPVLASEPAFSNIEMHHRSNGGVYLSGRLETADDFSRLYEKVIRAVGETRAKEIMMSVHYPNRYPNVTLPTKS